MAITLHPHLKRGLDVAASPVDARDAVGDVVDACADEAAKRRRVEAVARRCLSGRPVVLLTAGLKGPFGRGWRNPWEGKRRYDGGGVASPEASRAVEDGEGRSEVLLGPLGGTAPVLDEEETEVELGGCRGEKGESPRNPFWLRRPVASVTFPANGQTDTSPSKRQGSQMSELRQSLHLAQPKECLAGLLPIRATPPEGWSFASAPMDISSPAEGGASLKEHTSPQESSEDMPDSSRLRADSAQEDEARSSQAQIAQPSTHNTQTSTHNTQTSTRNQRIPMTTDTPLAALRGPVNTPFEAGVVQLPCAQSFESLVPATTYKVSSTVLVAQSSPIEKEDVMPKKVRHNLLASPAPDSSTGFMYRRLGQGKNEMRRKPRAVSFSSSPASKQKRGDAHDAATELLPVIVTEEPTEPSAVPEIESPQQSHRSKHSQYSTQAAMLLAQLEFQQDSSQSPTSSTTLRPWSPPAQNTPPTVLHQASPAMTPLSVFNAQLRDSLGGGDGVGDYDGVLVSTQDLFAAASPFAFSTVKKGRSGLRVPLKEKNAVVKETAVMKENVVVKENAVMRGLESPKVQSSGVGSQSRTGTQSRIGTQSSTTGMQSPRHLPDARLPQLDFHTSLDFGPKTDFTECLLRGLDCGR